MTLHLLFGASCTCVYIERVLEKLLTNHGRHAGGTLCNELKVSVTVYSVTPVMAIDSEVDHAQ